MRVLERSIRRPPGLRLDTGGTGKGLAADLLALRLPAGERWAIDCGGDLRVRAPTASRSTSTSGIRSPASPSIGCASTDGAVATSGSTRLWRAADGTPRHHILDPATGEPAWTGVIGATALAPTALEAEALAKAALLSPARPAPAAGCAATAASPFLDDGEVVFHGAARPRRSSGPGSRGMTPAPTNTPGGCSAARRASSRSCSSPPPSSSG